MPYQASCWSTSVSIFLQGTTSNGPYITLLSYAVIFIEIYFVEILWRNTLEKYFVEILQSIFKKHNRVAKGSIT